MKVITRAVWQMTDAGYELLAEDSYDYDGPVALAFGGASESSTSSSQATSTQNLNLQEIDGLAVAGVDGNVSIATTDQGTVDAAREVALTALDNGASGFRENIDLAGDIVSLGAAANRDVLDASRGNLQDSLDFAGDAVADGQALSRDVVAAGLEFGRSSADLAGDAFASAERQGALYSGFVRDTAGDVFDFADASQARSVAAVADASQGFNEALGGITDDFIQGGQALIADVIEFARGAGTQIIDQTAAIQARESGNTDARLEQITRAALIGGAIIAGFAIWSSARH